MTPGRLSSLVLLLAAPTLSGCVAAVAPIAVAGLIGGSAGRSPPGDAASSDRGDADRASAVEAAPSREAATTTPVDPEGDAQILADVRELPPPSGRRAAAGGPDATGDGAAAADVFDRLATFAAEAAAGRSRDTSTGSVVLMPDAALDRPTFTRCDGLPPAVLVDLDDDGAPGGQIGGTRRAADAFDRLRAEGVDILFVTAGPADRAAALDAAGLGPATRDETLWVVGDRASTSKPSLHWKIASSNCIIAMAGDRLEDFTILLAGRDPDTDPYIAPDVRTLIGGGWFLIPDLVDTEGQSL